MLRFWRRDDAGPKANVAGVGQAVPNKGRSSWLRSGDGVVARLAFFVLVPICAGALIIFQLRGWGQVAAAGSAGWCVVAIAGLVLGGLLGAAKSRIVPPAGNFWIGIAAACLVAGVGIGSAVFDRFAALGGLELSAAASPLRLDVGQGTTVHITLHNTSSQGFADVTMHGPLVASCFIDTSQGSSDAGPYDVGPLAAGETRTWSCATTADAVANGFLFADGDPTDHALAGDSNTATGIRSDVTGFTATYTSPDVALSSSLPSFGSSTGPAVAIVLADRPSTYRWKLTNIGRHAVPVDYVVTAFGSSGRRRVCAAQLPAVAPGRSVVASCTAVLPPSVQPVLQLDARDPATGRSFVTGQGVEVTSVAPDQNPSTDPNAPIAVSRTIALYPGSVEFGAAGYGSQATRIRVTNGPTAATSVVVRDTAAGCSRNLGDLAPRQSVGYDCRSPALGYTSPPSIISRATVTADVQGVPVEAMDTTTSFTYQTPSSLPATGGPPYELVANAVVAVSRHFVGGMILIALLGLVLIGYDRWADRPSRSAAADSTGSP
jgi:hypothetical protein